MSATMSEVLLADLLSDAEVALQAEKETSARLRAALLKIQLLQGDTEAAKVASETLNDLGEGVVDLRGHDALSTFFGLGRASWLTIPRVLLVCMSDPWQQALADLLNVYEQSYPGLNDLDLGTRVCVTDAKGRLTKTPDWMLSYRHPDPDVISTLRGHERK